MASSELQPLLQALEERSTGLGEDDIAWAFEASRTRDETKEWVRRFMNPTCLLSSEEHTFYEKQGVSKEAQSCQPISDQSFEDAISSLEASTVGIEKQCRLMEAQKQALRRLNQQSGPKSETSNARPQADSKVSRERSRLDFDCNELSGSLQARFDTALKQSDPSASTGRPSIERLLEKDDRLLDGLERILPHFLSNEDGMHDAAEVEKLCRALKAFTSAEIRARIDAAYLEAASSHTDKVNGVDGKAVKQAQQLESLHAELEELCREIEGLSTMSVDNQYFHPISHATQTAKAESEVERLTWAEYLSSAVQYITGRMEYMHDQLDNQRAHTAATKSMSAALEEILNAGKEKEDFDSQRPSRSPTKSSQKGLKPLRLVQANLSESHDPTSQLLRQLEVRIPGELGMAALSKATNEKHEDLRSLTVSSERGVSDMVAQSLSEADEDVQQLLGSVFANSKYGITHIESEGVRSKISELEAKIQDLSGRMRKLDLDELANTARSRRQNLLDQLGG